MRLIKDIDAPVLDIERKPYTSLNGVKGAGARIMYLSALGMITEKMKGYVEGDKIRGSRLSDKIFDLPEHASFDIEDAESELLIKCLKGLDLPSHMETPLIDLIGAKPKEVKPAEVSGQ